MTGTWVQANGGKGGSALSQEKAADAGTWIEDQGQASDTGGGQVWETSRWTALRTGRGGGDQAKTRGLQQ